MTGRQEEACGSSLLEPAKRRSACTYQMQRQCLQPSINSPIGSHPGTGLLSLWLGYPSIRAWGQKHQMPKRRLQPGILQDGKVPDVLEKRGSLGGTVTDRNVSEETSSAQMNPATIVADATWRVLLFLASTMVQCYLQKSTACPRMIRAKESACSTLVIGQSST